MRLVGMQSSHGEHCMHFKDSFSHQQITGAKVICGKVSGQKWLLLLPISWLECFALLRWKPWVDKEKLFYCWQSWALECATPKGCNGRPISLQPQTLRAGSCWGCPQCNCKVSKMSELLWRHSNLLPRRGSLTDSPLLKADGHKRKACQIACCWQF
jgi:hypothetical protein